MQADNHISSICIVGGGTAGWLSALFFNRILNSHGRRTAITLVESPAIATVGVGEATLPALVEFLHDLQVDEGEMMRAAHATYKLAIHFENWIKGDDSYWHPFGNLGGGVDDLQIFHYWSKRRKTGVGREAYANYGRETVIAELGKSPRRLDEGARPGPESPIYAYHLDAGLFADYLRDREVARGVHHIQDEITGVERDARGWIAGLQTAQSGKLEADFYIDCTGFNALLIEKELEEPFIDWSHWLYVNGAAVTRVPHDLPGEMPPYTRTRALSSGWVWDIPLLERYGCGYVFSREFQTEDAAAAELEEFVRATRQTPDELDIRFLKFPVGRRRNFLKHNCLAVGLSGGFLEPLESTGIYLIQKALVTLIDFMPDRDFAPQNAAAYNRRMAFAYEETRDFLILHYILTEREDSDFWKAVRNMQDLPDSLAARLELYNETGFVDVDALALFRDVNYYSILAGMERLPRRNLPLADFRDLGEVTRVMSEVLQENLQSAAALPAHRQKIAALNGRG